METDLSYCAGLFDGEGSITVRTNMIKGEEYLDLRICIHQNDPDVLEFFKKVVHVGKVHTNIGPRGNRVWQYQAGGASAAAALMQILPYLILKKEQAEIAIEASHTMNITGTREKLSADIIMQRRVIVAKFEAAYQRRRGISYGN